MADDQHTFGPQTRKDPTSFVLLALCALGWLWIAYDLSHDAPDGGGGVAFGMLTMAAVTFLIGAATWWFSPRAQARLGVSHEGLTFEQWRGKELPFRRLSWEAISAFRLKRGAWGRMRFGIVERPSGPGAKARVWWLDLAGLDLQGADLMAVIEAAATRAGFGLRATGKRTRGRRAGRWQVHRLAERPQ